MKRQFPSGIPQSQELDFLIKLNAAFLDFDWDLLESMITDDFIIDWVGDSVIHGKKEFMKFMRAFDHPLTVHFEAESIAIQGNEAAQYGNMTNESGTRYRFADFIELTNEEPIRAKKIVSFIRVLDKNG